MLFWEIVSLGILVTLLKQSRRAALRQSLRRYDYASGEYFPIDPEDIDDLSSIISRLQSVSSSMTKLSFEKRLSAVRGAMDSFFADAQITSDVKIVDALGVQAEWVQAGNIDPRKRFLYIHGGAFCAGSPSSHRSITSRLSEITCSAVLSTEGACRTCERGRVVTFGPEAR